MSQVSVVVRLPIPSLVVLIGPSGSGKSTWAASNFRPGQVVASDDLRALVGNGPDDQRAGTDAFDVLDLVIERRLRRRLTTVVDTLGLDPARRAAYRGLAARYGVSCHAVIFDTSAPLCRARNKARTRPVPPKVLTAQLAATAAAGAALAEEGFDGVHQPAPVRLVPPSLLTTPESAARQKEDAVALRFGLQIPRFGAASGSGGAGVAGRGGSGEIAERLGAVAVAAEQAGFSSLWVMDHFIQIPQVGPEWQEMLDSYTTLGFLAGRTRTLRLGALVTGITYRNLAHLAKIVATLDVLSGGRAICGLGAAWFEREHRLYGWEFPPPKVRYQLLEDALELFPLMWGPGSPPFHGRTTTVPETICYPRPRQARIPILVGGSGEKRTLRLVARHGDACNLFGDPETVRRKLGILAGHCRVEGRTVSDIRVTHLSTVLVGTTAEDVAERVEQLRPRSLSPESFAVATAAGTVDDHIGRFRQYADAGVHTAIVNMPDLDVDAIERFSAVIAAFPGGAADW